MKKKLQELVLLLPGHGMDDFPMHYEGHEADELLAAWSALWHPVLLAAAASAPSWAGANDPPDPIAGRLIVIPEASNACLPDPWPDTADGAILIREERDRDAIVARAIEMSSAGGQADPELVADFFALGFCYLQVELLTRQMRYSSHVDASYFDREVAAGAVAALQGERDTAKKHLVACFETLAQARDQFYPVDSYLVDLTLVAETTIGASLRDELDRGVPSNLVLSGKVLNEMAVREPQTLAALRQAIKEGRACVLGGEYDELELPLVDRESILDQFQRGALAYQRHLGQSPKVFARRRFGLTPILPQILDKLGFVGAVHVTFDGGHFALGEQAKIRWEGQGSSAVDALAKPPLDASAPESFINLARRLGDSMDSDHVATLCFAHWPGTSGCCYDDLRRAARFGTALGKFVTLDDYFSSTDMTGILSRFEPDDYQSPYLRQAVEAGETDPITRHTRRARDRMNGYAATTIRAMADFVRGSRTSSEKPEPGLGQPAESEVVRDAAREFAQQIARGTPADEQAMLLANPFSFAHRANVEIPQAQGLAPLGAHVRAVGRHNQAAQAVVDVPGMGFAWIGANEPPSTHRTQQPPLAEENILRNEHFEVVIHPDTGAIHAIRRQGRRGNLLAGQIAYRSSDAGPDTYSVMAADAVEVTASTAAMGEIVSRGHLLDRDGGLLTRFEQTLQLWRGSRVLLMEIALDPEVEPEGDPWNCYYAARFAWPDAESDLWRSVGEASCPTHGRHVEAPHFVEIRSADRRVSILSAGLPFHRRSGPRTLDTLLAVQGETARRFRLGIGVNLSHTTPAALAMLAGQPAAVDGVGCPPQGPTGWLLHVDAKNLVVTHWEPLWMGDAPAGFRARLLETEGRAGRACLRSFREVQSALQTDYRGQSLGDLSLEDGTIIMDYAAHEWIQVEAKYDG